MKTHIMIYFGLILLHLSCTSQTPLKKSSAEFKKDDRYQQPSMGNGTDDDVLDESTLINGLNNVVWIRYRAIETRLTRALDLDKDELCNELGQFSCINKVHLFNLGGNDPFVAEQGRRASAPTVLTPLAIDRVAMHACTKKIAIDKSGGSSQSVIFDKLILDETPISKEQVEPFVSSLYQRILSRNPTGDELNIFIEFAQQGVESERFAKTSCFIIASMLENIFI